MSRIVIALGGNALGNNPHEQRGAIEKAARSLIELIEQGHEIVISHGNGPQVGMIKQAFEISSTVEEKIPNIELPECTAMSQGYIGFHLQNGLLREIKLQQMSCKVAAIVTQTIVDEGDPGFKNPTKPIGGFVSEQKARQIMSENPDIKYANDAGRGWRRMVASPEPTGIVEIDSILNLLDHKLVVIACGGGGIPVVKKERGFYEAVSAVIDKDFSSALLATSVHASYFFSLTTVERVAINWGKENQKEISEMTVSEARTYCEQGHFAEGSMLPKVQAAINFASADPNNVAVIASLEKASLAMKGLSGTTIRL